MIRVYLCALLAAILAGLHALPFVPRPDRLFGAAVPSKVRHGDAGREALGRYERDLLPWTVVSLMASLVLPLSWAVYWLEAAFLIPLVAACRLFFRERAGIQPLVLPASPIREATLAGDGRYRLALLFLGPLAILAATALYLHFNWVRIPARFPVHWGTNGVPNGWSTRSVAGVYGPLLLGGFVVVFLSGIFMLAAWGSRASAQQPAGKLVPIAVAYCIAVAFSAAGLLPLYVVPPGALVAVILGFIGFIGVMIWLSSRRRADSFTNAEEITPDRCWHGGEFYYNPADPALFVEKRVGIGLTLNFGHRGSWVVLGLILLVPASLAILAFALVKR